MSEPRIKELLRGRISRFSLYALVNIPSALGQRVHVEREAAGMQLAEPLPSYEVEAFKRPDGLGELVTPKGMVFSLLRLRWLDPWRRCWQGGTRPANQPFHAGYNLRWLLRAIARLGIGAGFLRLLQAALSITRVLGTPYGAHGADA